MVFNLLYRIGIRPKSKYFSENYLMHNSNNIALKTQNKNVVSVKSNTCSYLRKVLDNIASGTIIFLDTQKLIVKETIALPSGVFLIGRGSKFTTIELESGASCHVFSNKNHEDGDTDIGLAGFTIQGNMESQERPKDSKRLTFCCGIYLRRATDVLIDDITTINIRQTGAHFSECKRVNVSNFIAKKLGWSGISTSGTSEIDVHAFIFNSGLDVIHSGVHFDGGSRVSFRGIVHKSRGNGIMLDSAYSELSGCFVDA